MQPPPPPGPPPPVGPPGMLPAPPPGPPPPVGPPGDAASPAVRPAAAGRTARPTAAGGHRRCRRHARRRSRGRRCGGGGRLALPTSTAANRKREHCRAEEHDHRCSSARHHLKSPHPCVPRYPRRPRAKHVEHERDQARRDSWAWISGAIFSAMYACPASLGCTPSGPIRSGLPTNHPSLIGSMNVAPASLA